MREIRQSGSEGGAVERPSLPLYGGDHPYVPLSRLGRARSIAPLHGGDHPYAPVSRLGRAR